MRHGLRAMTSAGVKVRILGVLSVSLLVGPSQGALASAFTFSYQFAEYSIDGQTFAPLVTGSFDGTQSGDDINGLVTGISNVRVFRDGVPFLDNGALKVDCPLTDSNSPYATPCIDPVASFNFDSNLFVFIDNSTTPGLPGYNFFQLFEYSNPDVYVEHCAEIWSPAVGGYGSPMQCGGSSNWTLSRVPEPGTLALLGLGLAGLGLSRRRKA